jgi:uncharacterized protein YdaU (DUF1376 family)
MSKAWMPFYGGDFIANTMHLSRDDLGSYILLLWHHWEHGCLPGNDGKLARIARVHPPHWPRVKSSLIAFFDVQEDGSWTQKRVIQELNKKAEITNKRKASAEQMHSKRRANAYANAPGLHHGLHTQSQSQSPIKKVTVTVSKPESGVPVRSGSNGPRTGNAQIGERIGDYFWDGLKWAEIPEADQPCPF